MTTEKILERWNSKWAKNIKNYLRKWDMKIGTAFV
jgi:hypothetical protein